MATASIPVPTHVALLIDWFRRSWRAWFYRLLLDVIECHHDGRATNLATELSAAKLMACGHTAAAVWASRTKLELKLSELCDCVGDETQILGSRRCLTPMVTYLLASGALWKRLSRRCCNIYSSASKIVHKGTANRDQAVYVISEIDDVMVQLDHAILEVIINDHSADAPHKPVLGFAGGAA